MSIVVHHLSVCSLIFIVTVSWTLVQQHPNSTFTLNTSTLYKEVTHSVQRLSLIDVKSLIAILVDTGSKLAVQAALDSTWDLT